MGRLYIETWGCSYIKHPDVFNFEIVLYMKYILTFLLLYTYYQSDKFECISDEELMTLLQQRTFRYFGELPRQAVQFMAGLWYS